MTETYDVVTSPQFTADSPRPRLQILVGNHGGHPCVDLETLYWYFVDSYDWNREAGDQTKLPGLLAAARAVEGMYLDALKVAYPEQVID